MNRYKALNLIKSVRKTCETHGVDIPQSELDFLDSIINKLELKASFDDFTIEESEYLDKTYKAVYE